MFFARLGCLLSLSEHPVPDMEGCSGQSRVRADAGCAVTVGGDQEMTTLVCQTPAADIFRDHLMALLIMGRFRPGTVAVTQSIARLSWQRMRWLNANAVRMPQPFTIVVADFSGLAELRGPVGKISGRAHGGSKQIRWQAVSTGVDVSSIMCLDIDV